MRSICKARVSAGCVCRDRIDAVRRRRCARDLAVVSWGGAYSGRAARGLFQAVHGKDQDQHDRGKLGRRRRHAARQDPGRQQQLGRGPGRVGRSCCSAARKACTKRLDWAKLGGKDKYLPDAVNDCGVGAIVYSFILAYDGDKIKGDAPKSWADFWNVQKWPGKRALRKGPKTTLEIALMADGVAPKDVYKTLGTNEGVERAFKKLDQLKPNLVWWEKARSRRNCSASGEVAMTDAYNGRIAAANDKDKKNFKIVWTNNLYTIDSWVISEGLAEQGAGRDVPGSSSTIRRTRRTCRRRSPTARRPRRRPR